MAITFRDAQKLATSGGPVTVTKPTGTVDGDLLVALVYGPFGTTGAPAGWTLIRRTIFSSAETSTWYRVASGEGASYTFSAAFSWANIVVACFAGIDTSSPLDVESGGTGTSSSSIVAPSITTTQASDLLVGMFASKGAGLSIAPPTGFTEPTNGESQGQGSIELSYLLDAGPSGATGTKTAIASGAADFSAHLAAFKIAAGGGGTTHALAGTTSGTGDASGALTNAKPLAATSAGIGAQSATANVAKPVNGTSAAIGSQTGALAVARPLAGTSTGVGDASGAAQLAQSLDGTSPGSGDAAGNLVMVMALAGLSGGAGAASGLLATARPLAGVSDGIGDQSGALSVSRVLAGVDEGVGDAVAELLLYRSLAGQPGGVGGASAALSIATVGTAAWLARGALADRTMPIAGELDARPSPVIGTLAARIFPVAGALAERTTPIAGGLEE